MSWQRVSKNSASWSRYGIGWFCGWFLWGWFGEYFERQNKPGSGWTRKTQ